jgi:murein DD-endopeptidase MepM/ murein hydrolase activator NlpD
MARLALAALAALAALTSSNVLSNVLAAETADNETALFERLGARERVLESQTATAAATARDRTLLAYRMARRRELGFMANPEGRLDEAQTFGLALVALRRSLDESQTLARELDRVRSERTTLESALVDRSLRSLRSLREHTQVSNAAAEDPPKQRLPPPVRGTAVAVPGVRHDGPTKVELRHDGVEILARLNEPVRAVAAGAVTHVENLPQGGFAVVVAHDDGRTSIVSGLRDFAVKPGEHVGAGQILGLAGRNLDGAAVISVEIWQRRQPIETAKLLRVRL